MTPKAVLFDLDGTLVDHFDTITRCINFAQEKLGMPLSTRAQVCGVVGGSIKVTLQRLFGEENVEKAYPLYEERFTEIWKEDLRILPGARWILEGLKEKGIRRAIFTNKQGNAARAVVDYLELTELAGIVMGTGDTPWRKPQPEFTNELLKRIGVTAQEAVLIGDSPFDVQTGNAVGMDVYVVSTGSHSREQLQDEPVKGVHDDLYSLGREVFNLQEPVHA